VKFNIFQTFYQAAPNAQGHAWIQVIDGRPVQAFTKAEFKRELRLIAKGL
jgi:hypothetical protein